ncbi:hypothetical protein ASZ90_003708 [hydrocarbon metagenome]|uniref:Uncharacterized protein n=1 Tax=hydrocarbon metagenome TaxID=938273 RepID=A0A0W8G064_9ZZZZ
MILLGLSKVNIPSKAPYGHKYLHQKFLTTIERTNKTAITIKANREISAKK